MESQTGAVQVSALRKPISNACPAALLEESVVLEQERGKAMQQDWSVVRDAVNSLVINGELDVVKLKKDLTSVK